MTEILIDTPENLTLEAEVAGFGSRCLAAMIDYLILFIVMIVFACAFASSFRSLDSQWALAAVALVQFVLITFYHLLFEFFWNGQTPGKRRLGIRVVQANGMPLTTGALVIRNLVRLLDYLPLFYGLGLVVLFASKHSQRLGDYAAGTIVIRERGDINLNTLRERERYEYLHIKRYEPVPPYVDISQLDEHDRLTVVNYLSRRGEFQRRDHLATMLANKIADRMQIEQPGRLLTTPRASETFLEYVARAFELAELN